MSQMAATSVKPRSLFGEILRRELEAQEVSIRELARRLSTDDPEKLESHRRTLGRYIAGYVSPGDEARGSIARALAIDPSVFAEQAIMSARRERVAQALMPLADVLLEIAVEVAREREPIQ